MQTVTLDEAEARLRELIASLAAEQEIVITSGGEAVARIHPAGPGREPKKQSGSIFDLKPFSVGKVLKPVFNREEVWDEMIDGRE